MRFVSKVLGKIFSFLHILFVRIFSDFPLLLLLFTILVLIFFRNSGQEVVKNLKEVSMGFGILSFIILVIIISAQSGLESDAKGRLEGVEPVSHFKEWLLKVFMVTLLLSLQLFFCISLLSKSRRIDSLKEDSAARFTDRVIEIEVLVNDEPVEYFENYLSKGVILQDEEFHIQFRLPKSSHVRIGDVCVLKGRLYRPDPFDGFDYPAYLQSKGIYRLMRVSQFKCEKGEYGSSFFKFKVSLLKFKGELIDELERNLPEPQASLLAGIIFGQKRVFSPSFDSAVKNVGVSHVVAASGYNISFVAGISARLFGFLTRRKRAFMDILLVLIYCVLSGLSPSILRAGLMYSLSGVFVMLGVHIPVVNILFMTLAIFLLFDPSIIVDIGFQLSFASTVALMYIAPMLEKLFRKLGLKSLGKSVFLPTLACTLGTLPITIYTFKTIPLFSVLVNTIVLPFIDTSLILGVLALVFSNIAPIFSKLAFLAVWVQLKFFEIVVQFFGSISWSMINLKGHF